MGEGTAGQLLTGLVSLVPFAGTGLTAGRQVVKAIEAPRTTRVKMGNKQNENIDVLLSREAYKDVSAKTVGQYVLDEQLSNRKTKVYHNPTDNKTIIAHRGTSGKTDLINDFKVLTGTYDNSRRVHNATVISRAAAAKYQGPILQTGHSLGGTTAQIVGGKTNTEVDTYNKGTSPFENYKSTTAKQTHNITVVDPISAVALVKNKGVEVTAPKHINVHSISNFQ